MAGVTIMRSGEEPFPGYRLGELIGRGGAGEVWQATDPAGDPVALKFVSVESSKMVVPEIRAIQMVQRLEHPGLTRIFQVWSHRDAIVIAMELAEGSLQDMLDVYLTEYGAPLPVKDACKFLTPAADALDFLNARQHMVNNQKVGLQHCDIKPSNLLIFGDTVKLCDFGLTTPTTSTVRPHRRAGTPDYAAPEVFQGRLSDRTDQFALGVTYCQLRGATFPYSDTPTTFLRTYTRPPPDLSMLVPAEQAVVRRALAPAPQDRWPSCRELIDRLTAAMKS